MAKNLKVSVVIPNWNGKKLIGNCLNSLLKQTYEAQIIVVDNGSTDGSVDFIKHGYPQVHLVKLPKNYGFAGGVNAGIKTTLDQGFNYIALLNNDAIAHPGWLRQLVEALETDSQIGIVASKILKADQKYIDSTGDFYSIWGTPFPRGRGEQDVGQYDSADKRQIFAASGGACLYRAKALDQTGWFDERFFAYYEDVDLSFRAQLLGWKVVYEPTAVVFHEIGATSLKLGDFSHYHMLKNYFYLYFKNMPGVLFWKYLTLATIGFVGRTLTLLARGKFKPPFKAVAAIIINAPGLLLDRFRIQKKRRVSAAYIDSLLYHAPSPAQAQKIPFRWFVSDPYD